MQLEREKSHSKLTSKKSCRSSTSRVTTVYRFLETHCAHWKSRQVSWDKTLMAFGPPTHLATLLIQHVILLAWLLKAGLYPSDGFISDTTIDD
jgi:hypothetical protein